ncbi:MAG: hypothetical protein HXY20_12765 [Acidobacteria bacterium]|nr:hypothetical protein [Acidobacteriota bacterium]
MRKTSASLAVFLCLATVGAAHRPEHHQEASGGFTRVFPQTANGTANGVVIRSGVTITNNTNREGSGSLRFFGDDGAPLTINTSLGRGESFNFSLQAGEILRLETDGQGPLQEGWTGVISDAELSGSLTFTMTRIDGSFLSEIAVGDSAPAGRQMIFAESRQGRYSAFAVCNPDAGADAHLSLELRGLKGMPLASKAVSLGPLAHRAEYVTETLNEAGLRDFAGVLLVTSGLPVSLVTLRESGSNYTSLPSVCDAVSVQTARDIVFPRVADGVFGDLRYRTAFLLLNNSDAPREATLEIFNLDGDVMPVTIGATSAARFRVNVPARGALELETDGRSDPGVAGWARVACEQPLGGAGIPRGGRY